MRRSVQLVAIGNLFSKALGFAREALIAALFGTGVVAGALKVAQTGVLTPANFLVSDALNAVYVPLYKRLASESSDMGQAFVWTMMVLVSSASILVYVFLWATAGRWIHLMAPGLSPGTHELATELLQIMAVGIPFYMASALLMFVALANDNFRPAAIRPIAQNLGLIAGALVSWWLHDPRYLAWGFTNAYIILFLQLLVQQLGLKTLRPPLNWSLSNAISATRMFWDSLRPLLLMPVLLQGCIVGERIVASLISPASVAAVDYARVISETLLNAISLPIAMAGLSHWSNLTPTVLHSKLSRAVELMLVLAIPISAFLAANTHLVVSILYGHGAFGPDSIKVTGDILFGMSLGLWAQVIGYVLIKALNASLRNKTALYVTGTSLVCNLAFNLAAFKWLGPLTLGLGNALYGIGLLVLSAFSLHLWNHVASRIAWYIPGIVAYAAISRIIPSPNGTTVAFSAAAAFAVVFWLSYILAIPTLRRAAFHVAGYTPR